MVKQIVFSIVGGLGLFLFGMGLMSDGLKQTAGRKLKGFLESLTRHRLIALLVGALATCFIQSSSATTVMTVGFVNAGLLSLKQALSVVLGANIGTTFTAWLVSALGIGGFKITAMALPAIGIGFFLQVRGKTQRTRSIGSILLGFGILFVGISFMKDAFAPLKNSVKVQETLIFLGQNPLLAVLAGTVMTMLLQSSSASIMTVQLMAYQGAFGTDWPLVLAVTIPFILGDNIGTTITAELAAMRTSRNSKRVARGHTLFNCIGVLYILPLVWVGLFPKFITWLTPWHLSQRNIMLHLAIAHSVFNVVNAGLFISIIGSLEALVYKLVPLRVNEAVEKPVTLENHLLSTPVIALEQVKREIIRMAKAANKALNCAIDGLLNNQRKKLDSVRQTEDIIDDFQLQITSYLCALSKRQLSDELAAVLPVFLHTVNDLERVGDHAVNIVELGERKIEQKLSFTDSARKEAEMLRKEANQMFACIITALEKNDTEAVRPALANEQNLNRMQVNFRRSHVGRMTEGRCTPETGLIFIDLVDNVEKIGDHLTNIAQAVAGGLQWEGVEPKIEPTSAPTIATPTPKR